MRLALNLGYLVGSDDPQDQLRLTRRAEELGFDSVWTAEAYGSDTPTVLAWLGGQTTKINLGAAVMQIPARTPAMTAMTAASLDRLTDGRFRLGLGVSGPQVSEGWHGVRFDAPLGRTREYLEILELALDRKTVSFQGKHFRLPLPDGPGKPLKLMIKPASERIPRYLAAVGPKNLELCGRYTDGWLGIFYALGFAAEQLRHIENGRARIGKTLDDFDVMATVPLVVGDDVTACAHPIRPYAALYIGGMGSREQNFYNRLAIRMGYEAEAAEIQDLYLGGRQRDAMAAVPEQFIDDTSLIGDLGRLTERLQAFAESGLRTCAVAPYGPVETKLAALQTIAEALERSGVGD
ncbi:LLM class F420-dependent oxidoreductase [Microlunatus elymi]|uniref:LLM class F420-dependent oxidoreductase n=1 Tax=Microlunatus elymi TaxID=2596828 RepID=A0A516Q1P7_9ACTN|nr:LLM class F420-dependent oxidoreductase [Microlunatus elymi]QDP97343.1 LLM class F420-dependent oxidoreductase [Microlunatus elymi]